MFIWTFGMRAERLFSWVNFIPLILMKLHTLVVFTTWMKYLCNARVAGLGEIISVVWQEVAFSSSRIASINGSNI